MNVPTPEGARNDFTTQQELEERIKLLPNDDLKT
jgi:hypothetical protein